MSIKSETRHGQALQDFRLALRLDLSTAGRICHLSRGGYRRREQIGHPDHTAYCFRQLAWWSHRQGQSLDVAAHQVRQARQTDQGAGGV